MSRLVTSGGTGMEHSTGEERARKFRALHEKGTFVMPNAWDAGSAQLLASAGFHAIGTTSAGIAYALGYRDSDPRLNPALMFEAIGRIVEAVDVPVSADLEAGFGTTEDAVAATIRQAIELGCAGGSLEDVGDYSKTTQFELLPADVAAERVRVASETINTARSPFVLTARTECFLTGHPQALDEAIERLTAFRAAGAHCLYAPGISEPDDIATLVRCVGGPVNVLATGKAARLSVSDLTALGVRRISTGSGITRAVLGAMRAAASGIAENGTFEYLASAPTGDELDLFFARQRPSHE